MASGVVDTPGGKKKKTRKQPTPKCVESVTIYDVKLYVLMMIYGTCADIPYDKLKKLAENTLTLEINLQINLQIEQVVGEQVGNDKLIFVTGSYRVSEMFGPEQIIKHYIIIYPDGDSLAMIRFEHIYNSRDEYAHNVHELGEWKRLEYDNDYKDGSLNMVNLVIHYGGDVVIKCAEKWPIHTIICMNRS